MITEARNVRYKLYQITKFFDSQKENFGVRKTFIPSTRLYNLVRRSYSDFAKFLGRFFLRKHKIFIFESITSCRNPLTTQWTVALSLMQYINFRCCRERITTLGAKFTLNWKEFIALWRTPRSPRPTRVVTEALMQCGNERVCTAHVSRNFWTNYNDYLIPYLLVVLFPFVSNACIKLATFTYNCCTMLKKWQLIWMTQRCSTGTNNQSNCLTFNLILSVFPMSFQACF